ncbi:iron complex transport system substrate-binding protein [Williamsia limnetica]|jgi:iron complex transport system substrate-binding protein|uniref:Iron complex transport system substrate-binding protein n=1 Tax=Williamsia limnetica TaxID=882452 RepID=A0A318RLK7_WILLI|nr:ABC transporter substrate-binding protein [Williamsia limnetica]PYE16800.1 iron complex transport system substrate-binding protein [Williamsia limnetica]
MRARSNRPTVLLALLAALTMVLVACSSPEEDEDNGAPIQVNTPMGQVTINGVPKNIVTIGTQWTDVALAFGVTPVAYLDNVELLTKAPTPWVGDRLESSQAIDPSRDVASQVAAVDPDLIVSTDFGDQTETFAKLSKLAPTIPSITGKQVDPWEEMVVFMGTVLREPEKAQEIINGVNSKIDGIKEANPGLQGKSFALAWILTNDQIQVFGDPADGAAEVFTSMGMTMAPELQKIFQRDGQPRFPISTENVPELQSDMMILAANSAALNEKMKTLPGYSALTSVKKDAVAELSVAEVSAINQPSPLSLPFVLEKMTPAFENAAK